jgi:predicted phosphoribosyltransferase
VLATHLSEYAADARTLVLGLARGGVPVAAKVAENIGARLKVFIVCKVGVPTHPEFAMGAVAEDCVVLDDALIARLRLSSETVETAVNRATNEWLRRGAIYGPGPSPADLADATAILVDDGLATGFSMRTAVRSVRQHGCARLVVAVPVGAPDSCAALEADVDRLVCPLQPESFFSVSQWYDEFAATTDDEVRACLEHARHARGRGRGKRS